MIASKAARSVLAAPGRLLVDFGLRRAHGAEAGLFAARSCYLAGFAGSSTVLAGALWEIPVFGTMAHSFVEAHENEEDAFENFARTHPEAAILLIDTYDTERGARRAAAVGKKLQKDGIKIKGVRIDSGDLAEHAKNVRKILDENGLAGATIFASGNLDEYKVCELLAKGAAIDGFGIGTALDTSADAPSLDCAYKLQEYAGIPRRKRSEGKATWPGKKQVFRNSDGGFIVGDLLSLADEEHPGQPLIREVMKAGKRSHPPEKLADIRSRTSENLSALPESLRKIDSEARYLVEVSGKLRALAAQIDRAMGF